jgi:hypothetical protein
MPENAQVLASNSFEAAYLGLMELPCRGMTADCPDKCGHATKVARFRVIRNVDYAQNSEYGDEKVAPGSIVMVDVKKPTPGQDDAAIFELIDKLELGNKVIMTQEHCYGEIGNLVTHFRPVTKMEIIPGTKAEIPATEAPAGDYSATPIQSCIRR